jgi:hypothetical protein
MICCIRISNASRPRYIHAIPTCNGAGRRSAVTIRSMRISLVHSSPLFVCSGTQCREWQRNRTCEPAVARTGRRRSSRRLFLLVCLECATVNLSANSAPCKGTAQECCGVSGTSLSLSAMRPSSGSERACIFCIALLRCTFTVASAMPISRAVCLLRRPRDLNHDLALPGAWRWMSKRL